MNFVKCIILFILFYFFNVIEKFKNFDKINEMNKPEAYYILQYHIINLHNKQILYISRYMNKNEWILPQVFSRLINLTGMSLMNELECADNATNNRVQSRNMSFILQPSLTI